MLCSALVLGAGVMWLWLHFNLPAERAGLPPLLLSGVVFSATLAIELALRPNFVEWFAVVPAALGSGTTVALSLRARERCNLCNRRLRYQAVTFRCPRCSMKVCDETCWNFEHRRCELCLEHRVPVLPQAESWWSRATGPRATQGRCLIRLASAAQADLRPCPNCRRTQCRSCWDFNNGECSRCGTALPDLPVSFGAVVDHAYLE